MVKNMSTAEFELYLGLLKYAYEIQLERTGLVCGTEAEALRDKMYVAIQECLSKTDAKDEDKLNKMTGMKLDEDMVADFLLHEYGLQRKDFPYFQSEEL